MLKIFRSLLVIAYVISFILINVGVSYAAQINTRSLTLSDPTPSATTTWKFVFSLPSSTVVQSVRFEVCTTPFGTCTVPTGWTNSGISLGSISGIGTGFSSDRSMSDSLGMKSTTNTTAPSATSTIPFTVTNPSAIGTFYVRITTYSDSAYTTAIDTGNVAASVNNAVTVTATVQEQLTFCIYTGVNCAAGGGTVTLGNTQGVLSTTGPFVDKNTEYDIQTNAGGGAVVNIKGTTLTAGSSTIAAMTSATTSSPGTSQFGLCTYEVSGSSLTPYGGYNGGGGTLCKNTTQTAGTASTGGDNSANFYFNTANTTSTYGDEIASDSAGNASTGSVVFMANISLSQTAGIYTTTLNLIATGTY